MRRTARALIGIGTTAAVAVGLALAGASGASAATTGHWGTFSVSGQSRAYTGTMALEGFPETTFTSTSRQASVISGASTWQGSSTPPGAQYGSSRNNTYINQRPMADQPNQASAATTTYTFAPDNADGGAPAGGWSFVLGDIDADQATISATLVGGGTATAADIGYQASYNSCSSVSPGGWSCGSPTKDDPNPGSDKPTWNADTLTLTGNAAARDTAGASAWFSPTVPLKTLTITYQQRSGFPVYQTWFADKTISVGGVATLNGDPLPGAAMQAVDPAGNVIATTTTDGQGRYSFPSLLAATGDYRIEIDGPPGSALPSGDVIPPQGSIVYVQGPIADGDTIDFPFTAPAGAGTVTGVVTGSDGSTPVAGVPVAVADGNTTIDTSTNDAGFYSATVPAGDAEVSVNGEAAVPVTVPTSGSVAGPAPSVASGPLTVTSTVTPGTDPSQPNAGATVTVLDSSGAVVANGTTDADGAVTFPALLPGDYTVTITPPAGATAPVVNRPVTVTADTANAVAFPFATPQPVVSVTATGKVVTTVGTPVGGVTVTATTGGTDPAVVTAVTAADGSYSLDGLTQSTTYTVTTPGAAAQPLVTTTSATATVENLVVPAPPVSVSGTVTATTGSAEGLTVTATSIADGSSEHAVTGADGAYEITGLTPDTRYTLEVGGVSKTITTPATGTLTGQDFVLAATQPVTPPPTSGGGGTGTGAGSGSGVTGGGSTAPVVSVSGGPSGGELAYTGSDPAPALLGGGLLIGLGLLFLVARAIRARRGRGRLTD